MNTQNLDKYIIKSLEYFDTKNQKYDDYTKSQDSQVDEINKEIKIKSKVFNFQTLGTFDVNSKVWLWSWVTPYLSLEETKLSREILNYGLKLEPDSNAQEHYFIKGQIINSRMRFQDEIQLEIFLASICAIIKDKYDFLFKRIKVIDKDTTIFVYYLIKDNK